MTPLEKMARAMMAYQGQDPDVTISWSGERVLDERKRELRAALQSLKNLDEGTVEAGIKQHNECTDGGTASAACVPEHVFATMINHILKDEQ